MEALVELIAALSEAVVEAIAALCRIVVSVVMECFGFAARLLVGKSEEGRWRLFGKRLVVALTASAALVALMLWLFAGPDPQTVSQALVEERVDRLAGRVDERGRLERHPATMPNCEDAWGNPLRIRYEETMTHQLVFVQSAGADAEHGTADDIVRSRMLLRPKRDMAKGLLDKVVDEIKDRVSERDLSDGDQTSAEE